MVFNMSICDCTLHIMKQSSGHVECKYLEIINNKFHYSIFIFVNIFILFLKVSKKISSNYTLKLEL